MNKIRHTVIVGLGVTGLSCLRFLYGKEQLTLVDTRAKPDSLAAARESFPESRFVCGEIPDAIFEHVDRAVVSPGVSLDLPMFSGEFASQVTIISDIDLFLDAARVPVLGITGTNGKSTVTELCGALLCATGLKVGLGGNLGVPALDLLKPDMDVYVLELSSFQLERLRMQAKHTDSGNAFSAGCLLNISGDHIDRHGSYEHYLASKRRLIDLCDVQVYNRDDHQTAPDNTAQRTVSFGSDLGGEEEWGLLTESRECVSSTFLAYSGKAYLDVAALKIRGRHNVLNALAALALAATQHDSIADFIAPLMAFGGLDHRCQTVAYSSGVTFINDSKATNVGACLAALEGLGSVEHKNIVLIAGGDAKNADMSSLREAVAQFVKYMVVIGKDAQLLADVSASLKSVSFAESMLDAVQSAVREASSGDVVLLSPACASFDMYPGFEARGAAFVESVERVAAGT